ncbi:hypothetical protein OAP88_00750 [Candidatus Pelagibacter sp.]|nr:hypothetical protein [Candidatus Pelagibacter sp.]
MDRLKIIYFLINNEYQLIDTKKHLVHFSNKKYKIILLNGSKSKDDLSRHFKDLDVINLNLPQIRYTYSWFLSIINFFKFNNKIKYLIKPNENTFLFFYTEVGLANHLVVKHFKNNGGKVFIINDAGFSTYLTFSDYSEKNKSILWNIRKFLTKLIPHLEDIRLVRAFKYNYFFWLPDKYIDGVIGYNFFQNKRNFPTYFIKEPKKKISKKIKSNNILYFNSTEYEDGFLTLNQYFNITKKIISELLKYYSEVIFKFHPRDTVEIIRLINNEYSSNKRVKILNPKKNYHNIFNDFKIRNTASIFSSASLSVPYGISSIFCFHLVKKMFPLNFKYVYKKTEKLLMAWGGKKINLGIRMPYYVKKQKKQKYFNNLENLIKTYN